MIVESYVQAKKKNHQVFLVLVCVFEGAEGLEGGEGNRLKFPKFLQ